MVEISASILAADLGSLENELDTIETANRIHVDIMDGHFVPNIALGFPIVKRISALTDLPVDVHLMISNPAQHVSRLTELDVHSITVHSEVSDDVSSICRHLRNAGIVPGVAVNPDTEIESVESVVDTVDRLTIMGVHPGFSGQSFIEYTVNRIKQMSSHTTHKIEVDGGIDSTVSGVCIDAGADILVSGSTIFESSERRKTIQQLREPPG